MLWMGCHSFHMSYECIIKVLQAWDIINIMWSGSFKPQSTQVMGPDLTAYAKPPQAILVIEYIVKWRATCHGCVAKHSIWCMGHVQDPPSLGHNQYTGVLSIQTHKHPSCGTRFDENCKTTMPSSGLCILLHKEQHAMDMLPPIPFVGAWLRSDKAWDTINTLWSYSSEPQSTQAVWPDLVRTTEQVQQCHPQVGVCCYKKNNMPWMCCQAFHIFMGVWARYNKPET